MNQVQYSQFYFVLANATRRGYCLALSDSQNGLQTKASEREETPSEEIVAMRTARLFALLLILFLCTLARSAPVFADTTYDLNLAGIGNLIPVESYTIDPHELVLNLDGSNGTLFNAAVTGEIFATGSLETFDSSFSTTTPITSFNMTDILITSIQFSGSNENPMETATLAFSTGTLVNNNVPEPSSLILLGSGLLGLAGIKRGRIGC